MVPIIHEGQITVGKCSTSRYAFSSLIPVVNYSKRLKRLGLPTLEYRPEMAYLVEVYKTLNNIDLVNKDKLFEMAADRQTRGRGASL